MNKVKWLLSACLATMALTACDKDDNPVIPEEPTVVNVDEPQEEVTDQPAFSRVK